MGSECVSSAPRSFLRVGGRDRKVQTPTCHFVVDHSVCDLLAPPVAVQHGAAAFAVNDSPGYTITRQMRLY